MHARLLFHERLKLSAGTMLVLVVLAVVVAAVGASRGNPHPQLLKAQHSKMQTMLLNRGIREKANGLNKAYRLNTNNVKEEKKDALEKLEDSVVELYVRRVETGPWSFFQYLSDGDGPGRRFRGEDELFEREEEEVSTAPMSEAIAKGGIEAEAARAELDRWVAVRVFGEAFGEPLILGNVRTSLKPFRKLKPRLMQFGYKLLGEDLYVSALDRAMTQVPQPVQLDLSTLPVPAPVHVSALLGEKGGEELQAQIEGSVDRLLGVMEAQGATSLLVVSDGSATFYGKTCLDASGGLVAVPVMDKSQVFINLGDASDRVDGVDGDGEPVRTRELNPNSFQVINKPSHSSEMLVREEGGANPALYLRIDGMGGIVGTPFDAELIAGLAAVTLARMIVDRQEQRDSSRKLDIRVLTDSRALRTLLRSTKEAQEVEVEVHEVSEEVGANRAALRLLCAAQCDYVHMNAVGPSGHEVSIEWTAGHPERRDGSDTKIWSARDKSMWVADDIARSSATAKARGGQAPTAAQAAVAESARKDIAGKLCASDGLRALDGNEALLRCSAEQLLLLSNGLIKSST
ncbi:hypothetical protein B484DRAFT_456288 [Ochromonadaceae sp. CCMP2298]|nr:hypothetical protein B484DRAFT_456288 [Ochromonadaceae sp. CCMP2298]